MAMLLAIKPPPGASAHSRRMGHARHPAAANAQGLVEGDIVSTTGWVRLIASEADGDYRIQIAGTDKSMARCFIVEAPRPAKKFVKDDRALQATASIRQALLDKTLGGKELKYGTTEVIKPPIFVNISNQFFYDDWHIRDQPCGKKSCKSQGHIDCNRRIGPNALLHAQIRRLTRDPRKFYLQLHSLPHSNVCS